MERAGKFLFLWQVASKSPVSFAHQAASAGKSHGDLREFSRFFHYRFTRKALFMGFSGRAERKRHLSTGLPASTALRPRATCPTCHSGICHGFLSRRMGIVVGAGSSGQGDNTHENPGHLIGGRGSVGAPQAQRRLLVQYGHIRSRGLVDGVCCTSYAL